MTDFLGCIPEQMRELDDLIWERAGQIRDLLDLLGTRSGAVHWTGADAEAFRAHLSQALQRGAAGATLLEERGTELGRNADEQDAASAPDGAAAGSPLEGLRMTPPSLPSGGSGGGPATGPLGGLGLGQPFGEDPTHPGPIGQGAQKLSARAVELAKELGGAFVPGGSASPVDPALIRHEDGLDYDPELLAFSSGVRSTVLGEIPVAGQVQSAMDLQSTAEQKLAEGEDWLVANGHEEALPLVRAGEMALGVSGVALGDGSPVDQTLTAVDRQIANRLQTTEGVISSAADGDLAGAARELEYGVIRDGENLATFVMPNHAGAVLDGTGTVLGAAAGLADGVAPDSVTGFLEDRSADAHALSDRSEEMRGDVLDPQRILAARRAGIRMPWDPDPATER